MELKQEPLDILRSAKTILLVDWPGQKVPRTLVKAGFTVFTYCPDEYSVAKLVDNLPGGQHGFPPADDDEKGFLVFEAIEGHPDAVDIVNLYRPENEHERIIEKLVLPLKAKVLWLQPPVTSAQTAAIASAKGLIFIEDIDIAELASKI